MLTGPSQTAHQRLAALARRRLLDAEGVGPMPEAMRARLQEEVARLKEAGPGVPEPVPIPWLQAWWQRWRAWVGMIGVGLGATVVLVWMIQSGPEQAGVGPWTAAAGRNQERAVGRDEAFGNGLELLPPIVPIAPPDATPEPSVSKAVAATPAASLAPGPLLAVEVPPAPVPQAAEPRRVQSLQGVVRLRRKYVASADAASPNVGAPILQRFEVVRNAERLEFRDEDGSIYVGRVETGARTGSGRAGGWVFEGRGTNVISRRVVSITGMFEPGAEARGQRVESESLLDHPFSGTVVVGEAQGMEVRAEPQP